MQHHLLLKRTLLALHLTVAAGGCAYYSVVGPLVGCIEPSGGLAGSEGNSILSVGPSGGFAGFRRSLVKRDDAIKVDRHNVRRGQISFRFELRDGDCSGDSGWDDCRTDRERAEFSSYDSFPGGEDRWFAWSIYVDPSYVDIGDAPVTLGQLHQRGGKTRVDGGFPSVPPTWMMSVRSGFLCWEPQHPFSQRRCVTSIESIKGRWVDFVLYSNPNPKTGSLRLWMNGEQKLDVNMPFIDHIPRNHYFKFGIYRAFISRYKRFCPWMPVQIVWFDEVRTGRTREEVDIYINPTLEPVN